ncbi:MAG: O-antigen ligase family protein [Erysipelotrichaceae bacterium]|nr:O-antigen ligase family protein [Erysipelotrichaceae bacterium]
MLKKSSKIIILSPYILLTCFAFSLDAIVRYLEQIIERIPIIGSVSKLFVPCLFILLVLLSSRRIKKIRIKDFLFIFIFYILLGLSFVMFENNQPYIELYFYSIVFSIVPYYFLGLTFEYTDNMKKWLRFFALISIIIAWLYLAYYYSTGRIFQTDSMYEAYAVVIHVMILLDWAFEKLDLLNAILSVAGVLYLLSMGTRGPLLIVIIYCGVLVIRKSFSSTKKKVILICILILLAVIFGFTDLFKEIITWMKTIVGGWGLSTRVFDSVLYGVAQDSLDDRSRIYTVLLRSLSKKPFLGYGLYGEYPFIEWSAHNMFLQTCFEFGYIIGIPLILAFIILSIKVIKKTYKKDVGSFVLLWICYIFPQSFFGGNIVSYYMFFTIGLFIMLNRETRFYNENLLPAKSR